MKTTTISGRNVKRLSTVLSSLVLACSATAFAACSSDGSQSSSDGANVASSTQAIVTAQGSKTYKSFGNNQLSLNAYQGERTVFFAPTDVASAFAAGQMDTFVDRLDQSVRRSVALSLETMAA